jgi:hypothetical protein
MKIEDIIHKERGHVMCRLIKEASFDEWLTYLFDRPECDYGSHWCFDRPDGEPDWDAPREVTADFIARTYEDPKFWMGRFTIAQLAAGLEYTWNPSFSDVGFAIRDEPTPLPLRFRAVRALVPVYQQCFQSFCDAGLSNLGERLDNPMNGACYMYWDVCPFFAGMADGQLQPLELECLRTMETTLQIDHDACRESALHGLGHWRHDHAERVEQVIGDWLKRCKNRLRPELLQYAEAAACGCVQ